MVKELITEEMVYRFTGQSKFIVVRTATLWERIIYRAKIIAILPTPHRKWASVEWCYKDMPAFYKDWAHEEFAR